MSALFRAIAATLAITSATSVHAAWHKASSKHFVIYSDDKPERLREFAAKLEKFDQAVRFARSMQDHAPGQGNRLTVFVVSTIGEVQKLSQSNDRDLAGFYTGRATGSIAFVPRRAGDGTKGSLDPETIFFHEYAHHLMMQEISQPYPEWLIEGFAEFMSTARFERDGSVGLGAPALHRAYSLLEGVQIPIARLLAGNYGKLDSELRASLYARGWLLAHYLTFEPQRQGQLASYLQGIAKGDEPLKAAEAAFGDLRQLEGDVDSYLNRRRMTYLSVPAAKAQPGAIDIIPLSAGAAAILPFRMKSKRGVDDKTAGPLADQIRAVATKYPDDAMVQEALAEAEYDAGNLDAAWAAAERALKADSRSIEAMIYKGRVMMAKGEKSGADAEWKEARRWLLAANKIDTEDPEPLMLFYQSYVHQGERPTANAIAALHYASRLAPQDGGLRMNSAMAYLAERKLDEARLEIAPIAYDPHGGAFAAAARRMLEHVAKGDVDSALGIRSHDEEASEE